MAMVLGNIRNFKGTGLVAFLDVLGFSQEIINNWDDEKNNPLTKLLELKENLPIYTEKDIQKHENSPSVRTYVCRVQTISDSIVVSFGFQDEPQVGDVILGTIAFLDTIAVIWRNTIEAGFTLRRAMDFGKIYWSEKEIIGPAFITAYSLEQTHAKTSRVILSSGRY